MAHTSHLSCVALVRISLFEIVPSQFIGASNTAACLHISALCKGLWNSSKSCVTYKGTYDLLFTGFHLCFDL
jgi:hypothetical protein